MVRSRPLAQNMEIAIFLLLAAVAIASAANILIQRHPIYSALSLIVTFVALAGIYIQMHAEFIAVMQIVVYTGAIMVLFIFVIMLLNVGAEQQTRNVGANLNVMFADWLPAQHAIEGDHFEDLDRRQLQVVGNPRDRFVGQIS